MYVVITDRRISRRPLVEQIDYVCRSAPRPPQAVIVREKDVPLPAYEGLLADIVACCQAYGVPVLAHSHPGCAKMEGIVGVHMPLAAWLSHVAHDVKVPICAAEGEAYPKGLGISVHSVAEAVQAQRAGATYLLASPIQPTACKPEAIPLGWAGAQAIVEAVTVPVYGLGGFTGNEREWRQARAVGMAGIAVRSAAMML